VIAGAVPNPVTSVADYRAAGASAVPTDLPASLAIGPVPSIPAVRNDPRKTKKGAPNTSRVVIIDPQTNAVVFRPVDAYAGAVIDQVPAQALLRQRAYVDAQAVARAEPAAAQDVDTTA
jgi:hypothetical protein